MPAMQRLLLIGGEYDRQLVLIPETLNWTAMPNGERYTRRTLPGLVIFAHEPMALAEVSERIDKITWGPKALARPSPPTPEVAREAS